MKSQFVLLSFLLYATCFLEHPQVIQHPEYCVASNNNQSNISCHTLEYYMRNSSLFFKNNTTFLFYPGDHLTDINVSLYVSNVSGLTLKGYDATIRCENRSNFFHFDFVQDLVIKGLNFHQCGFSYTNKTAGYSTLLLTNVTNFELTNALISESDYQGILLSNTFGTIFIANLTIELCRTFDKQPANAMYFKECFTNFSADVTIRDTVFLNNVNKGLKEQNYYLGLYPYAAGLTVVVMCPGITVYLDNITAKANVGKDGGNLAFIFHTANLFEVPPVIVNNSNIRDGVATQGGGIFTSLAQPYSAGKHKRSFANHTILSIENTLFENNSASFVGGAISVRQKESNISSYIGGIHIKNCTFIQNSIENNGGHGGTAITSINFIVTEVDQHISPQFKTFISGCSFLKNHVKFNKNMTAGTAVIFVKTNPYLKLSDITINGRNSSGILGLQSNLVLSGNIMISNNSAESGGGILLCQNAVLYLESGLDLMITNNSAQFGGGIAVESVCVVSKPICFFQLASSSPQDWSNISIHLHNNAALNKNTGSNLYGGSVDFCYILESSTHDVSANGSLSVFNKIFDIHPNYSAGFPYVTSQPNRACICLNNKTNCDIPEYHYPHSVYPGQLFKISIVLVGQLYGSAPGYVVATLENESQAVFNNSKSKTFHDMAKPQCNEVSYVICSNQTGINVTMEIKAALHNDISVIQFLPRYRQLKVTVSISDCPKGFTIVDKVCECDPVLSAVKAKCIAFNQTIVVPNYVWVGYVNRSNVSTIVSSKYCPPEYCNTSQSSNFISASLTDFHQDSQCKPNRVGIMCGQCAEGYSATFGGGGCVKCSNHWLWYILVYIFAGMFLVFVLTFLDITVADGTINGLIFYANVVEANHSYLYTHKYSWLTSALRVFTGWLSLKSEIETCFYNGMSEYSKAWMSFLFPFYMWVILGLIIVFSRRFKLVMRIIGTNAVKVLATLILLSYSRLLQSIISAVDFTAVTASSDDSWLVWTKDGNIHFLRWKHLLLLVFSVCLLILLIPFTLLLLFIQIMQRYSHHKVFCFVNKFKPLLDAYTGPYSDSARFWTGYLLLARIVIFFCSILTDRFRYMESVDITTATLIVILTTVFFLRDGVYTKKWVEMLEGSLLLNLALLLLATDYAGNHKLGQASYTNFFVGTAFLTFLAVVIYHVAKQIFKITLIRDCILAANRKFMQRFEYQRIEPKGDSTERGFLPPVVRFTEDREPLLADN